MATNGSTMNGTNGTYGRKLGPVDDILDQVTQSIGNFKTGGDEKDRLEALKAAQQLVRALHEPKDNAYHLAYSPTQAMCVRIGIDLKIFSTLSKATEPMTLKQLAAVEGANPFVAERVLRILSGIEYVAERDVHVYTATRMTHQMADRYSVAMVKFNYDFGMSSLAKIPEWLRNHNHQVVEGSHFMEADRGSRPPWVEWFPVQEQILTNWRGGDDDTFFVDVAGGRGHDIKTFKHKFPNTKGKFVLEDLPHVIEQSVQGLDADKIAFDLFKPQPVKGARIYYMKFILHDWSDAQNIEILKHIREAMKPGYSTLIIEEFILPDKDCPTLPAMWDWEMMVFLNSMERSEGHWRKLLSDAGFEAEFFYPPGDGQGIIRAEIKQ
ncbi:O-methyltransferase [Aspergillus stella-maris]|uniref:O-methyltransferase n=1 Tax=Aspergillus stella-maris TaxID=1810926 RepID=UPI003CCE4F69